MENQKETGESTQPNTPQHSEEPSLEFIHAWLINGNRAEVRRFNRVARKLLKTKTLTPSVGVIHDVDGVCCIKEPWNDTANRLFKSYRDKHKK
jgi:hypothetical protein